MDQTEKTWIHALKQGDTEAFQDLLDHYERSVLNVVYRTIGNAALAEELTQEVFLKVYKGIKKYKPEAKFSTWLFRIVRNVCLNEIKRQKYRKTDPLNEETFDERETDRGPDTLLEKNERIAFIQKALLEIPERQRLAIILQGYLGHTNQEIAEILETSVSAVEALLCKAKQTLRQTLAPLQKP